jgi:uncharacterized protein (TIGR02246 family)
MTTSDESALVHLSLDYADAVRCADAGAWGELWADDAVWVLGPGRRMEGREAIVATWRGSLAKYARVVQLYLSHTFAVDGVTASGRLQLMELVEVADGSRRVLAGHYDDTYTKAGGRWRFASRALTQYYSGPPDLSGAFVVPPG